MASYSYCLSLCLLLTTSIIHAYEAHPVPHLKSVRLCNQCSKCESTKCPPSEAYPHMTAFDDTLIAGALQSDYVDLTVDKHDKVSLQPLRSLDSLADADWKSYSPPKKLNHREFRFWVSHSTGKCLTVFGGKTKKRTVGVAQCKFDGSNRGQLFAFRYHYHQAFCCCGVHND